NIAIYSRNHPNVEIFIFLNESLYTLLYNSLKCEQKRIFSRQLNTPLIRQQHLPQLGYAPLTHPEISYG
ncbi:hypothetical protein OHD14_001971, partial [Citrobacter freundii]